MTTETFDDDTVASVRHFVHAARDSVADEMIGRMAETFAQAVDLLDRLNRSNVYSALPIIERLVENNDLTRIVDYARIVSAAEDSLTDDMVGRIAEMGAEALTVVDRLNRSGVGKLVDILDKMNSTGALDKLAVALPRLLKHVDLVEKLADCAENAAAEARAQPASGGLLPLLRLLSDAENQAFIRFALSFGRNMMTSCVKG